MNPVKNILLLLLIPCVIFSCKEDEVPRTLAEFLTTHDDIVGVTNLGPLPGYESFYRLTIRQNIDHNNPGLGSFNQEVFLRHKDEELPVVLGTRGYSANQNNQSELSSLIESNYISIEHRYFAESVPGTLDWQYLTIEQAAADVHHIVDIFDDIYEDKWVSTGASKGGMTALFHKRFFPDDVDAVVAYVAPVITGLPDPRFDQFLSEEVGDEACRTKIENFQRLVLTRRDNMLNLLKEEEVNRKFTFGISYEETLEMMALEYQFSFWQYGQSDCGSIPDETATDEEVFAHLAQVSPSVYYDAGVITFYHPFFYQAYTELGYYYYIDDHVEDLIEILDEPNHKLLAPNVSMTYDPTVMQDIITWLGTEGDNIIYIYGADDPYTATAAPNPTGTNALYIVQQGQNHSVKIADLDRQSEVYDALEEWLELTIN